MKSLSSFTRLFIVVLILLLLVAGPATFAQDVETPSPDTVTLEATAVETLSSTIVPTEVATEAPTATPVPVPPPPPTPMETILANINWTVLILAMGLGLFGLIAYGFRLLALSVPVAVYEGGKAAARANYGAVDRIVEATPDPTDNILWKAFHDKLEEQFAITDKLRQEMGQLKSEVATNKVEAAQNLSAASSAISQQISASGAPPRQ